MSETFDAGGFVGCKKFMVTVCYTKTMKVIPLLCRHSGLDWKNIRSTGRLDCEELYFDPNTMGHKDSFEVSSVGVSISDGLPHYFVDCNGYAYHRDWLDMDRLAPVYTCATSKLCIVDEYERAPSDNTQNKISEAENFELQRSLYNTHKAMLGIAPTKLRMKVERDDTFDVASNNTTKPTQPKKSFYEKWTTDVLKGE